VTRIGTLSKGQRKRALLAQREFLVPT